MSAYPPTPQPASRSEWGALWRRGQEGWPRAFPLAQFPNAPLLVYLGALVAQGVTDGRAEDVAWGMSRVALTIWAYEELARGVNWFRRGLGLVVLVAIVIGLADAAG